MSSLRFGLKLHNYATKVLSHCDFLIVSSGAHTKTHRNCHRTRDSRLHHSCFVLNLILILRTSLIFWIYSTGICLITRLVCQYNLSAIYVYILSLTLINLRFAVRHLINFYTRTLCQRYKFLVNLNLSKNYENKSRGILRNSLPRRNYEKLRSCCPHKVPELTSLREYYEAIMRENPTLLLITL